MAIISKKKFVPSETLSVGKTSLIRRFVEGKFSESLLIDGWGQDFS